MKSVRVRYAPSPTGDPHLGSVRTALFNWLFARRHGGTFILRIEDTDQGRRVDTSVLAIMEGLKWLGLDWAEGPADDGRGSKGPFGPYFQSHRLNLYHKYADQLIQTSHAYRCFCSPARLEAVRRAQQQAKVPPGYDRHCRDLPASEVEQQMAAGTPHVVRFRMPQEGATSIHDLVRGDVTWERKLLDDFVLLKSDKFPTYHLANIVDDHHMQISHVMRAEEWLPSTPRHVMLYEAFGWQHPQFAHMPLILGADRSKMSKRHGSTSVLAYRDEGYLPDAMTNFLALLGWSLDDKTEIIPREEMIRHFSIERITKAGAIFNPEKLQWINGMYIRALQPAELAEKLVPFLEKPADEGGLPATVKRPVNRAYVSKLVPLVQERLRILSEGAELTSFFFEEQLSYDPALLIQKGMDKAGTLNALKLATEQLDTQPVWGAHALEEPMRALAEQLNLKAGQFFGAIRVAVTGRTATPPLFQTMEVLGKERSMARLRQSIDMLAAQA